MTIEDFKNNFFEIKGKTIAVVYIFEGDTNSGFSHFFIWKGKILTEWINAIEELHCLPLILDVRTFIDKAINKTLPHIDYVLNMNSGTNALSVMALVPAMCCSINVPCIPCNAVTIVTGENKHLSNLIAKGVGIQVPLNLDPNNENGIFRPINLGNSLGVKRGSLSENKNGIYQEFIFGYDITTPIVYNPLTQKMDLLPTVMYLANNERMDWFNGEDEKRTRTGYKFKIVQLDQFIEEKYVELVQTLGIQTFCRIDARVKCMDKTYHSDKNIVSHSDVYFIEINVMPTIRENNNFYYSFESIGKNHPFYPYIKLLNEELNSVNLNKFLLTTSMFSYLHNMQ